MNQNDHDQSKPAQHEGDPSDSTRAFDSSEFTESHDMVDSERGSGHEPEPSLFEQYEPRSLRTIIHQQRAYRDSQAAEAAKVILDGIEPPDFDMNGDQVQTLLDETESHQSPGGGQEGLGLYRNRQYTAIRVQRVSPMGRLVTPGAQFIYALMIIMLLSGLIGLASSTNSPHLILTAGIATPMLLPMCIWKWIRWLDSDPYYYRLLNSLGEDARNLMSYRLFGKKSQPKR